MYISIYLGASPYNIDFLARTGGSPIAILAKDAFENMPEDSHIATSLLNADSINLSIYVRWQFYIELFTGNRP